MMIVHGNYETRDFTLTWKDGVLSGDDWMASLYMLLLADMAVTAANVVFARGTDILKNPWTFYQALYEIADDLEIKFNDEPEIPGVPKGCVA